MADALLSMKKSQRPFLKWAGGKRQLLPQIVHRLPTDFGRYYEPFVGAGALFFHLGPAKAVIADTNERLIRTYKGVKNQVDRVIELLREYPHEKDFFLELRERDIDQASDAEVAAWFIYLNKTAFNGLYRVNRSNRFNVPFGRYTNPNICDEERLRACARKLRRAEIRQCDFKKAVARAKAGDLVYFDPPYAPLSKTSNFTGYTASGFDADEQRRLRDCAMALVKKGVHVALSNSSAPLIGELYEDGFQFFDIQARRAINSQRDGRGRVKELLLVSSHSLESKKEVGES